MVSHQSYAALIRRTYFFRTHDSLFNMQGIYNCTNSIYMLICYIKLPIQNVVVSNTFAIYLRSVVGQHFTSRLAFHKTRVGNGECIDSLW